MAARIPSARTLAAQEAIAYANERRAQVVSWYAAGLSIELIAQTFDISELLAHRLLLEGLAQRPDAC